MRCQLVGFLGFVLVSSVYAGKITLISGKEIVTDGRFEVKKNLVIYRDTYGKLLQLPLRIVNLDLSDQDFQVDQDKELEKLKKEAEEIHKRHIDKVSGLERKQQSENSFQKVIDSNRQAYGSNAGSIVLERKKEDVRYGNNNRKYSKSEVERWIDHAITFKDMEDLRKYFILAKKGSHDVYQYDGTPFAVSALLNDFKDGFGLIMSKTNYPYLEYKGETIVTGVLSYKAYRGNNFDATYYLRHIIDSDVNLEGRAITDYFAYLHGSVDDSRETRGHTLTTYLLMEKEYALLENALAKGADANAPGINDKSAVFLALERNDLTGLKLVHKHGAAKVRDKISDYSVLEYAIKNGYLTHFSYLRDEAKKAGVQCRGVTSPLVFSANVAREDQLYTLQNLLKDELSQDDYNELVWRFVQIESRGGLLFAQAMGADLDSRNALGDTPLMHSVKRNQSFMVKTLTDLGADRNVKTESGKSLIDLARETKNTNLIPILSKR